MSKIKIFVGTEKRQQLLSDLQWRNDCCRNKFELVTSWILKPDSVVWPGMKEYEQLLEIESFLEFHQKLAKRVQSHARAYSDAIQRDLDAIALKIYEDDLENVLKLVQDVVIAGEPRC